MREKEREKRKREISIWKHRKWCFKAKKNCDNYPCLNGNVGIARTILGAQRCKEPNSFGRAAKAGQVQIFYFKLTRSQVGEIFQVTNKRSKLEWKTRTRAWPVKWSLSMNAGYGKVQQQWALVICRNQKRSCWFFFSNFFSNLEYEFGRVICKKYNLGCDFMRCNGPLKITTFVAK